MENNRPQTRRWRNQPLVLEHDRFRSRRMWIICCAFVLAITPASLYLYQSNECLKLSYAVDELREEQKRIEELERRLKLERARLEALPEIEDWALGGRHLVRPAAERVVVVRQATHERTDLMARAPDNNTKAVR